MKNISALRHKLFRIGIVLKGIDGVLEMIGGVLFVIISPATLNRIIYILTRHELSEDPQDVIANYLIRTAKHLSISGQVFGFVYLFSHGIIKLVLIFSLWKKRLWSYPVAMIFFAMFGIYQMYRYYLSPSLGWILLTVLDIFVVILTLLEYRELKTI